MNLRFVNYFFVSLFFIILNSCISVDVASESDQSFTKIVDVSEKSTDIIKTKTIEWIIRTFPTVNKKDIEINEDMIKFSGSRSTTVDGMFGPQSILVYFNTVIDIKSEKFRINFSNYYTLVEDDETKKSTKQPANFKFIVEPLKKSFEEYSIDLKNSINGNVTSDW